MLQIKTIKAKLENAADFDNEVNQALQEGWHLTRREALTPLYTHPVLYAELVKEELTEDEKNCQNCKHGYKSPDAEPCRDCSDNGDKWEPAE